MAPPRLTPLLLLVPLLGACQRDQTFVGYWEINRATRAGVAQTDIGFLDFDGDGNVTYLTRYLFDTDQFVPDPHPGARFSPCDVYSNEDIVEAYRSEGETYDLHIYDLSVKPMVIDEYHFGKAVVTGELFWPGEEDVARTTTLTIRR